MSANQAIFPVAVMARVLGVSKAGFYAWRERLPSACARADAALLGRIRTIHAASLYRQVQIYAHQGIQLDRSTLSALRRLLAPSLSEIGSSASWRMMGGPRHGG